MQLVLKWISNFILLSVLVGCASVNKNTDTKPKNTKDLFFQQVYYAEYDLVWRAAQLALNYPISINNMESGVLETDYIRAVEGFVPPYQELEASSGLRYKVTLTLTKGKVEGKTAVRVTIIKTLEKKRDFFSDPESIATDGIEERTIFYRIGRELMIEDGLRKAAAQMANEN